MEYFLLAAGEVARGPFVLSPGRGNRHASKSAGSLDKLLWIARDELGLEAQLLGQLLVRSPGVEPGQSGDRCDAGRGDGRSHSATAQLIAEMPPPADPWWHVAVALAGSETQARPLAEQNRRRQRQRLPRIRGGVAGGSGRSAGIHATAAGDLEQELASRERPLREQWEARGPGLLLHTSRSADPARLPQQATVWLVHPIQGGGGTAHPRFHGVTLEAMLYHPVAELPEPLRLAWLLAQLGETPHRKAARRRLVQLALTPAVLSAAERGGADSRPTAGAGAGSAGLAHRPGGRVAAAGRNTAAVVERLRRRQRRLGHCLAAAK